LKQAIFLILLLSFATESREQVKIHGKATDKKGHPLAGISIYIQGSYDGATTAEDGTYSFTTTEKGSQVIIASGIGYDKIEQTISISGNSIEFNPVMKEAVNALQAVTISAGSFEASDENRNTILKPLDIVTTAGAGADITAALKTLPGVQQIGEQEGLFVRGGTGSETQTFIDGMLVSNPYFSSVPDIAQRGRFSPFLFKGTVFSSGGYSAQYGQGMSGAVILKSEDLPDQSSSTLSVSSVGLSAGVDELSKDKTFSIGGDLNYTNLYPYYKISPQKENFTIYPLFWNGDFNFRKKISKTGMLKFYGYGNYEQLGFLQNSLNYPGDKDYFGLYNGNVYTNMTYQDQITPKWKLYAGLSYSTNTDHIRINTQGKDTLLDDQKIFHRNDLAQTKVMFTRSLGVLSVIRVGGDYQRATDTITYNQYDFNFIDNYFAGFAEADIYITPRIVARIGARAEHSTLLNKSNIAPRISMAYKVGQKDQFSLAYGDFYQKPDSVMWLADNNKLNFSKATHYIANFQRVSNDYTFRVEAYYKQYYNLIKTYPDTNNTGYGYAKGIEFFWRDRKTFKNVDYWISYSYLDTKRNYLNYPIEVEPSFATHHTLTVVYKQYFPKISTNVGLTYSFATGRPYYDPNLPVSEFMSSHTIDYNTLGLSLAYLTTIHKAFTVFVLSATNVLGNRQVFGYNYSYDGTRSEAITPPANRFIFVGMFMSFGINRSQDVIDSN
jgi:CarboxypepD_reg-like domain/TonB-dependent Receptor Plug Domain